MAYEPGAGANADGPPDFAESFVAKLTALNETQQSINTLSHWLRYHHRNATQAADIWSRETLNAPPERHLLFVYLLNDVLQTSRRRAPEVCEAFAARMIDVMPLVYAGSPPAVREKITRIINILEERNAVSSAQLVALRAQLTGTATAPSSTPAATVPLPKAPPPPQAPPPSQPKPPAALPPTSPRTPPAPSLQQLPDCLRQLQTSDVLDATSSAQERDINPLYLGEGELVADDPAHLQALMAESDEVVRMLAGHRAELEAELSDRKRLIVLLCNSVMAQEQICEQLQAAIERSETSHEAAERTQARLQEVRAHPPPCPRALVSVGDPAPRPVRHAADVRMPAPPPPPPTSRPRPHLRCRRTSTRWLLSDTNTMDTTVYVLLRGCRLLARHSPGGVGIYCSLSSAMLATTR